MPSTKLMTKKETWKQARFLLEHNFTDFVVAILDYLTMNSYF
jgi:hypothetical protein